LCACARAFRAQAFSANFLTPLRGTWNVPRRNAQFVGRVRRGLTLPCRVRYRAAWDTVPRGTPCRMGCHAAWDAMPRGMPCRAGRGDRAAHTVQCGAHDCAAHRTFRFTSFSCAKSAGTQAAELAEVGEALQADGYRRPY
jgi:hypothetical protein